MIKTFTISKGQKPTREQLQEVMETAHLIAMELLCHVRIYPQLKFLQA